MRKLLRGRSEVKHELLTQELGYSNVQVEAALAVLGAQGLVGFDPSSQHWFHRELPFDLSAMDDIHPRAAVARELIASNKIVLVDAPGAGALDYEVRGHNALYYVRLRADGDKCSCPWYSAHQQELGPCKHVLAARQYGAMQ